jgi:putative SOS response-associated peptidase YedK
MCGRCGAFLPAKTRGSVVSFGQPAAQCRAVIRVTPTRHAMVMRRHLETGERNHNPPKWGLLRSRTEGPAKAQPPINCRSETVAAAGPFRRASRIRRCIVPENAFYGGRQGALRHRVARRPTDGLRRAVGGVRWPGGEITRMFTIAATNANAVVSTPHHRMPVILEPADWPVCLGEAEGDFPAAATLARPGRSGSGRGERLNSLRNNGPELIASLTV